MKKFTLLIAFFVCAIGFSQTGSLTNWAENNPDRLQTQINTQAKANTPIVLTGNENYLSGEVSYTELENSSTVNRTSITSNRSTFVTNNQSNGGTQVFTVLADFQASCTDALTEEDFGDGPAPGTGVMACGVGPMSSAGNGCYAPGVLEEGFEMEAFGAGTIETVWLEIGFLGNTVDLVGPNSFGDSMTLTFNGADDVFDVGMILWNNSDPDTEFRIFDAGGVLQDSWTINNTVATENFYGVMTDYAIGYIEIEGANGSGELMANLMFGNCGGGGGGGCTAGVFTDRAAFDAEAGALPLEDLAGGPGAISACDGPINDGGNSCYAPGEILPGISITTNTPANADPMVFAPAGFDVNVDDVVGANQFTSFTIVEFPNGDVNSFGLDINALFAAASVDVRIFGTGGLIETVTVDTSIPGPVFFGYIADEIIVSAEIEDLTGGAAELVSQISFGECSGGDPVDCTGDIVQYDSTAVPFDIDGADTSTADCVAAPNLVPVTVASAEGGTIGVDAAIDNVTIDIAHTWSGDLVISLVSPTGAELLLAGPLGGNDDDAYNNTIFMDDGADITVATPPYNAEAFAPQGGTFAAAFDGESIDGDWSLKVCDEVGGDTGQVIAFSISFCEPEVIPPFVCTGDNVPYDATDVPFDIDGADTSTADCVAAPNLVPATVAGIGTINVDSSIVSVTIDITHTWSGDLVLSLVSPTGAELLLAGPLGGNDDDAYNNTIFMDGGADITAATPPYNAEPFAPQGGTFAAAFDGEVITGDWSLKICDEVGGDSGQVIAYTIVMCEAPLAGPPNDECADAIAVDCGTTNSGDTTDATNTDAPADCDGLALNTGPGVWYSLTIPADGDYNVSIDTEGSDFDTKLGLFTGDCGALVCVASDDDGGTGLLSLIDFVGTSGETYTIYVTAFGANSGLYDLNVACEIIGGNDDCVSTAPSNAFENGKSCTFNLGRIVAHDMDVMADMDMSLETISANLFIGPEAGGINAAFVDVHVYEDNAGAPGAEIDFQAGVVPTSQTEIGANFGFQIWEVVLDITPVDLAGQAGAATTYWVGLSVEAADASNVFWENSTAGLVGNGEAYDDGAGGGFVIDATLEGVYTFSGTCTILGTSDNTIEGFSYYPNPSTTVINVSAQDNIERVAIYNILGQKVVDQNINATSSQIDVSNLVTGAYLMDVSVNGRSATYKIIKN